ncbi:MAG: Smr/MutS family protein [Paracoccaceae bacterium]|nr:Smr/MutS family protein [Paracoccaceae bacterium]
MRRRRPRGLTPEESELWDRIAGTIAPLRSPQPERPAETLIPPTPTKPAPPKIEAFRLGEAAHPPRPRHVLHPPIGERLAHAPVQMDTKTHARMTRGKLLPEARIDLHGLTMAEAHPRLIRFILGSHEAGKRLVLVITGKGSSRAERGANPVFRGVLKHQVPQWLNLPPLGPIVLQVTEAHIRHGGAGAYYVYLRRAR